MTRPIPRPLHGPVDYLYVVVVGASPFLFGFAGTTAAAVAAWVLAGVVLVVTLLTRAEWGVWRMIPYRVHLMLDVAGSLLALAAPWLLGFSGDAAARNTFLAAGLFGLVAVALSKPEEMGTVRANAS